MSASITVGCNRAGPRTHQQVVLTITGTDTAWDLTTVPTLTATGSTCSVLMWTTDVDGQVIVAVANTGSGATTLTVGTTADDATADLTLTDARKHRRGRGRAIARPVLDFPVPARGPRE